MCTVQSPHVLRPGYGQTALLALLGTVAAGALILAAPGVARANDSCTPSGTTLTCSGDQADGIEILEVAPFETLIVNGLTAGIAPEAAAGIKVDVEHAFDAQINTGTYDIKATGNGAAGIQLTNYAEEGAVSLLLTGNVSSDAGAGIIVETAGNASSASSGTVEALNTAIFVKSNVEGTATVNHAGDITSHEGAGAMVTGSAAVTSTTRGVVSALGDAIYAKSYGDNQSLVTIDHASGSITSYGGYGMYALSAYDGASVTVVGDVTAMADGIYAKAAGESGEHSATIDSTGTVFSSSGQGLIALANAGQAQITSRGTVTSLKDAIYAKADGSKDASIDSIGTVTSNDGRALAALSADGNARIVTEGAVTGKQEAIYVKAGGTASVESTGTLTSWQNRGIHAESSNNTVTVTNTGDIEAKKDGIYAMSGSDTAAVTITSAGHIVSWDDRGIWAEAARGGIVIDNTGAIDSKDEGIYAVSYGDSESDKVQVDNVGDIRSWDKQGILAAASSLEVVVNNTGTISAKTDGIRAVSEGRAVTVRQIGDIQVWDGAGVHAESPSETVDVQVDGDITGGAYGIYGKNQSTDVKLTLAEGHTISGTSTAGVYLYGITTTTFDNYGTVDALAGVVAQSEGWADNTINNYGTMIGNFDLAGGHSLLNNLAGASMTVGNSITLNPEGVLTNAGTLSFGGEGSIYTTDLIGNFVQSATGMMVVDVDFGTNGSDRLNVTGTASLDGRVGLVIDDITEIRPMSFVVMTAGELLTTNLDMDSMRVGNLALLGNIAYVDNTEVHAKITGVEFDNGQIDSLRSNVAGVLTTEFEAGAPGLTPLFTAMINIQDEEEYDNALYSLTPQAFAEVSGSTLAQVGGFATQLLSCKVADGTYAFSAEGQCVWASTTANRLDRAETADQMGYSQAAFGISAGAQVAVSPEFRLGGAVGYVTARGTNSAGGQSSMERMQAGVVVKYDNAGTVIAGSVTGGLGTTATVRNVSIGQLTETLSGESDNSFLSGRLHAAHTIDNGNTYLRPLADLDVTLSNFGAMTEVGGVSALSIDAGSQLIAVLSPAIEIGGEFKAGDNAVARPYLRAGLALSTDPTLEVTARFVEGNGDSFTVVSPGEQITGKLSAGIDLIADNNAYLRMYYDGTFGANSMQNGFGIKAGGGF